MLHATKKEGETLLATKNTIYVAKRRVKMESLQGLSPIVHLKNQLGNADYSTCVKTDDDGTLKALFFCHHAVVFHLRYNAKSTWQRYCEQMSTCTGHSLQEEEVLSWLG